MDRKECGDAQATTKIDIRTGMLTKQITGHCRQQAADRTDYWSPTRRGQKVHGASPSPSDTVIWSEATARLVLSEPSVVSLPVLLASRSLLQIKLLVSSYEHHTANSRTYPSE